MNMEVTIPAIILENEEDDDLLIYCMSEGATDIFKKRKDERYYSTLIGGYLTDSEMKLIELFSFEGHFPFNLDRNRRHNNSKLQSMADTDFS